MKTNPLAHQAYSHLSGIRAEPTPEEQIAAKVKGAAMALVALMALAALGGMAMTFWTNT